MNTKALAVSLFLVASFFQPVTAAAYGPGYHGNHAAPLNPDKAVSMHPGAIVRDGIEKLQRFIKSGRAQNRDQALGFMKAEIEPYFDFDYMTQWAAGSAWRRMSPQQRAMAKDKLQNAFMNTLAGKLVTYTNQPIRYFTPRGSADNDVRVRVWIMQANNMPTRLEFRFYRRDGDWKIFDVKAEGNSAVLYYRKHFRELFRSTQRPHYQAGPGRY